jgi:uncharacterized protein (DUF2237 family)
MSSTNGHHVNGHGVNGHAKLPAKARNVLGGELQPCSVDPLTGFFRDGACNTGPQDRGSHTVCARVTQEFLEYLRSQGNDLITPAPQYNFPGLQDGDQWCVCAASWRQAAEAGLACPVVLEATHEAALTIVDLADLEAHRA